MKANMCIALALAFLFVMICMFSFTYDSVSNENLRNCRRVDSLELVIDSIEDRFGERMDYLETRLDIMVQDSVKH